MPTINTAAAGCGRNCLAHCCLPISMLPLYAFKKEGSEEQSKICLVQDLVLAQWEDRMRRGLFRYDVTTCETKTIDGERGFIAQFNEGRHLKKRPTEFRVDQVLQSFDPNKFNFTKVGQEEVLFRFEQCEDHDQDTRYVPEAPVANGSSPSVVAINVSPIEYGHVLLIPRVLDCLPQRIDCESFLLALYFAKESADPFFRIGYNSLGAFATINHLHFQAYYLGVPFPVEKAPTRRIAAQQNGVTISELCNYPVRAIVFEDGISIQDLSDAVARSCIFMQENNIPFNVLISACGQRIFLFPQCYAEKQAVGDVSQEMLDTQVNPAVWEISGHIVLKKRNDYENASEANAEKLLSYVSLSEERFEEVKGYVLGASGLLEEDNVADHQEQEPCYKPPSPHSQLHVNQDCSVIQ